MQPCLEGSAYDEMDTALDGAEGLREDWLRQYAADYEECNINHAALVGWIEAND